MVEEENKAAEAGGDAAEGEEQDAGGGKKKIIIIVSILLLSVGLGVGAALFLGGEKSEESDVAEEVPAEDGAEKGAAPIEDEEDLAEEKASKAEVIFYDFGEMLVNLNTGGRGTSFLKLKVTFEVQGEENMESVRKYYPKIKDIFQLYLRELRPADLQGSVGLYRLREELLLRVNKVIYPAHINDVLFKDVLVQ